MQSFTFTTTNFTVTVEEKNQKSALRKALKQNLAFRGEWNKEKAAAKKAAAAAEKAAAEKAEEESAAAEKAAAEKAAEESAIEAAKPQNQISSIIDEILYNKGLSFNPYNWRSVEAMEEVAGAVIDIEFGENAVDSIFGKCLELRDSKGKRWSIIKIQCQWKGTKNYRGFGVMFSSNLENLSVYPGTSTETKVWEHTGWRKSQEHN